MILALPPPEDPVDQGDIVDGCPILSLPAFDMDNLASSKARCALNRVLVMTQTCDLATKNVDRAIVAVLHDAQSLVDQRMLKAADIKGPIRAGRVWGWYFLQRNSELGLPEMIVDLRQLHTSWLDLLTWLC